MKATNWSIWPSQVSTLGMVVAFWLVGRVSNYRPQVIKFYPRYCRDIKKTPLSAMILHISIMRGFMKSCWLNAFDHGSQDPIWIVHLTH